MYRVHILLYVYIYTYDFYKKILVESSLDSTVVACISSCIRFFVVWTNLISIKITIFSIITDAIERGYPTRFTIFFDHPQTRSKEDIQHGLRSFTERVAYTTSDGMPCINEPNDEFLKIYDTLTGGWIFICNRSHGIDHVGLNLFLDPNTAAIEHVLTFHSFI